MSVRVERLVGGCGSVLVSSGLPLPPGRLTKGNLSRVRVVVGGVERAVYLEALHGAHADGSLRSILIQFTDTLAFGAPRDGYVIVGEPRGSTDIARPTADRGSPAAVMLPTDPAYLVSTGLVGPTVPVSTTASWPAVYQTYEQNFRTFADYHWNLNGATWTENYYDRAQIYYAWWLRTANLEYWRRATALALSYRRDYLEASNYNPSAHWSQLEGQELHYLATGDDASRRAVGYSADVFTVAYYMNNLADPTAEMENRIQARTLMAFLTAWRLNAPTRMGAVWATLLPTALTRILASQDPSGGYLFTRLDNQCGYNKPFMVGLLNDAFIKYYTHFQADPRIPGAVQRSVDYMWARDWRPAARAFVYLGGPCPGHDENQAPSPDLNNLIVNGFAWTARQTGNTVYRDQAEAIFAGGVAQAWLNGSKQFNENYTTSFRFLFYRQ